MEKHTLVSFQIEFFTDDTTEQIICLEFVNEVLKIVVATGNRREWTAEVFNRRRRWCGCTGGCESVQNED